MSSIERNLPFVGQKDPGKDMALPEVKANLRSVRDRVHHVQHNPVAESELSLMFKSRAERTRVERSQVSSYEHFLYVFNQRPIVSSLSEGLTYSELLVLCSVCRAFRDLLLQQGVTQALLMYDDAVKKGAPIILPKNQRLAQFRVMHLVNYSPSFKKNSHFVGVTAWIESLHISLVARNHYTRFALFMDFGNLRELSLGLPAMMVHTAIVDLIRNASRTLEKIVIPGYTNIYDCIFEEIKKCERLRFLSLKGSSGFEKYQLAELLDNLNYKQDEYVKEHKRVYLTVDLRGVGGVDHEFQKVYKNIHVRV